MLTPSIRRQRQVCRRDGGLATVTSAPAKAVGLEDRGLLEIGKRADLIRFAMRAGVPALQGVYSRGQRVA